jgi:hypothetical protein
MRKPKKKSPREKPSGGPEISKNSFAIEFDRKVIKFLASWPDDKLDGLNTQLLELAQSFGFPHRHAGLGIRVWAEDTTSFAGISTFDLFSPEGVVFSWAISGNHNAVRQFLRAHR